MIKKINEYTKKTKSPNTNKHTNKDRGKDNRVRDKNQKLNEINYVIFTIMEGELIQQSVSIETIKNNDSFNARMIKMLDHKEELEEKVERYNELENTRKEIVLCHYQNSMI